MFPKTGVPQNGWFKMENPIKMDDLRVPLFSETSICYLQLCTKMVGCLVKTPSFPCKHQKCQRENHGGEDAIISIIYCGTNSIATHNGISESPTTS